METSGTQSLIHFNNAGSSLPPDSVLNATIEYLKTEARLGGYETENFYREDLNRAYDSIAKLIEADRNEIAITESATSAWNMALSSIDFKAGDKVVTTPYEFLSNYMALLQLKKKTGVEIIVVPHNIDELKKVLDKKVKCVSLCHVPSTTGVINSLEGMSDLIKNNGSYFLLDACQSIGQLPVDVKKINPDFLCATGRKFLRAPRGSGFLYVAKDILQKEMSPVYIDYMGAVLGSDQSYTFTNDAKRFEKFELSYAAKFGFSVALEYALDLNPQDSWERMKKLSDLLRSELTKIPEIKLQDVGSELGAIVTFTHSKKSATEVQLALRAKHINVSTASKAIALDLQNRNVDEIIRASVHYYNTEDEIYSFASSIKSL